MRSSSWGGLGLTVVFMVPLETELRAPCMLCKHSTTELDPLQYGFQMPSKVCILKAWVLAHNTIADDAAVQKLGLEDRNEVIGSVSCKGL